VTDYGYARVSTRDQNPKLQLIALEQAGIGPDHIVKEAKSGIAKDRPVRDALLERLQPGDTLTVWKLDRLGRSLVELEEIVNDLDRRGVRFRCLTQAIDTSTAQGKLFFRLLAMFAEFERELMRERVIAGKQRMIAEGQHPGGPPLFGYAADHVTIVEAEAAMLRDAARRLLEDRDSLSRIVDDLERGPVRPRRRAHWSVTSLRRALLNERVIPIIGQDSYDNLRRLLLAPDRQRLGRPAEFLLSGILRCGRDDCEQPMYGAHKGGRGQPPQLVYRCKAARGSGGRFAGCGSTVVSMARADAWAGEAFIAAVCGAEFAEALNRRRAELLAGESTAEQLDEWREEIAELEMVLPTRFGNEDMQRRHAELERRVRAATARLLQQPELQALIDLPKSEAQLRAAWDGWTVPERRVWLRRVLHHVTVLPAPPGHHHRGSDVESRFDPAWRL
jgi:DNA invertase Pin-like site-specific DNA recombinase